MALAKLITAEEVISLAVADQNTYSDYIKDAHIQEAQLSFLKPYIGKDWYAELCSQAPSSYSTDNQTVIDDYIKPALAHYIISRALPHIAVKTTNHGLISNYSDTQQVANSKMLESQQNSYYATAVSFRDALISYIEDTDNADNYPLYKNRTDRPAYGSAVYKHGLIVNTTVYGDNYACCTYCGNPYRAGGACSCDYHC